MKLANPARPADGAALVAIEDLRPGQPIVLDFREGDGLFSLIVVRDDAGGLYAYENSCPHAAAPLERFDGIVVTQQRRFMICAMHGASFRIEDGVCVGGPALGGALSREAVYLDGETVRLGVGPVATA